MSQSSNISANIPDEVITEIREHLDQISTLIAPYTVAMTNEDRKSIAKMSDKTVAFVGKTVDYAETNAEFSPAYLDTTELGVDYMATRKLSPIFDLGAQICDKLKDIIMLSGHEAFVASLMYYNSVKEAASRGLAGAKPIYEDLSVRFPGRRRSS